MADKNINGTLYQQILLVDTSGNPLASIEGSKSVSVPSGDSSAALTPNAANAVSSGLLLKGSAGNLHRLNCVSGGTAGYVMVLDLAALPGADGTVAPKFVMPINPNTGISELFDPPLRFANGIALMFSSTGPYALTRSATAFLSGECI